MIKLLTINLVDDIAKYNRLIFSNVIKIYFAQINTQATLPSREYNKYLFKKLNYQYN